MAGAYIPMPANGFRPIIIHFLAASALWTAPVMTAFGEPAPAAYDPRAVEFFENRVRPILAQRCYKCHSGTAEKVRGGLLLDSRNGVQKGGDNGAVIVPGDPERSPLIRAVRYVDKDLQMPPKERLPAEAVAVLEQWVRMGAPDPRVGPTTAPSVAAAAVSSSKSAWSFAAVKPQTVPSVSADKWQANPIDAFVLAGMRDKGLSPAPPAGQRELLRRVTFDLTGLPPTPADLDDFLADDSPAAYEKVVDRLLASPAFGARWGRHWLDLVRYGESNGYEQNHLRPNAWPYRDYVIRSFNDDTPYDQFVTEQLAGDAVQGSGESRAATGFLVAGVHDTVGIQTTEGQLQQRANDLDDIVSTTGAAFLGLTVGCARCHDHKFDPILQKDYYRLTAVFAGVHHGEAPLPMSRSPEDQRDADRIAARIADLSGQAKSLETLAQAAASGAAQGDPLRPAVSAGRNVESFAPVQAKFVRFTVLSTIDGSEPCLDEIEVFARDGAANVAAAAAGAKASASSLLPGYKIHQVDHLNDGRFGNDFSWVSNERGGGWAQVELLRQEQIGRVIWSRDNSPSPRYKDRVPLKYRVEVSTDGVNWRAVASGDDRRPPAGAAPDPAAFLSPDNRDRYRAVTTELADLRRRAATLTPQPAYIGQFSSPEQTHLLKRGDVMQPGEVVAPGALSQVPGLSPELPAGSEPGRRLALARWICRPDNPLTARVMVNRIWQHHFGRGIVGTPSDFGANGEKPSHPELLDWLASDFVSNGWRMKRLHRMIVLSNTYRQSSRIDPGQQVSDGGNVYLWRMPLRRLEAEAVRDSILAVSGKLDARMGGPGYALFRYRVVNVAIYEPLADQGPLTWRRAVYQITARSIHDDLLGAFDEPESAQRFPTRESTTTPLQALTLLNSPFVLEQAGYFAERVRAEAGDNPAAQVQRAFLLAFGRPPEPAEIDAAVKLVRQHDLRQLCRAIFNANEFLSY